jgi:hypothetical protein
MSQPEKITYKQGHIRDDGQIFVRYRGGKEYWASPETFAKIINSVRQATQKHLKKQAQARAVRKCTERPTKFYEAEIRRHYAKGRDPGLIAVRLRTPISRVLAVIEKIKLEEKILSTNS